MLLRAFLNDATSCASYLFGCGTMIESLFFASSVWVWVACPLVASVIAVDITNSTPLYQSTSSRANRVLRQGQSPCDVVVHSSCSLGVRGSARAEAQHSGDCSGGRPS